jgi:preprotein translocase subunit SecG
MLVVHILVALGMIALILIQQGKGAEAGASFGGGASGTVFGAAGSANFLTRTTAILTAIFFLTSLGLAIMAKREAAQLLSLPAVAQAPVTQPVVPKPVSDVLKTSPAVTLNSTNTENSPSNTLVDPVH